MADWNSRAASAGSKTKTVVAASVDPSSILLPGLKPFLSIPAVAMSPGQNSSAHPPWHWATLHWMWTSEPGGLHNNNNNNKKIITTWAELNGAGAQSNVSSIAKSYFTFWEFEHWTEYSRGLCSLWVHLEFGDDLWIDWASIWIGQ